ncbi:MAG TPA: hypothetical protein P5116_05720, partial [Eubacteriales bacterium]|nr:hypothetical protein [Eubacteriales bacterium]
HQKRQSQIQATFHPYYHPPLYVLLHAFIYKRYRNLGFPFICLLSRSKIAPTPMSFSTSHSHLFHFTGLLHACQYAFSVIFMLLQLLILKVTINRIVCCYSREGIQLEAVAAQAFVSPFDRAARSVTNTSSRPCHPIPRSNGE